MKDKKRQMILLSVISIATLLVAIAGATFAWFSATVGGNENASSVIVKSAQLGIDYLNGQEIKMENAIPGVTSKEKSFTVRAADGSTVNQTYYINFDVKSNTFNGNDLVYSLVGETNLDGTLVANQTNVTIPSAGISQIGNAAIIKPNEVHTYKLSVTFREMNSNQNDNQKAEFIGRIQVSSINS